MLEFCALRRSLVGGETREMAVAESGPAVRNQTTRPAISRWSLCSHYAISMAMTLVRTRCRQPGRNKQCCPLFVFSIHSAPMRNTRYCHNRQTSFFSRLYHLPCGVHASTHRRSDAPGEMEHQSCIEAWSAAQLLLRLPPVALWEYILLMDTLYTYTLPPKS